MSSNRHLADPEKQLISPADTAGIGAAAMLFIFQGAFTIGFQATVWVYPSEILPLKLRQRGSSISTCANWVCNFAIVYITPPAIRNLGWKTYIIFAVLNATWVPIIVRDKYSTSNHLIYVGTDGFLVLFLSRDPQARSRGR